MRNQLAALLLALGITNMVYADTLLYVSDGGGQKIVVYQLHEDSGKLTLIEQVDVQAGTGSLAVDPTRKFLFASLRSTSTLASYRIGPGGKLDPINTTSLDPQANATYVSTDREGKYLLTASYSGGRVAVHSIDDGKLSKEPLQTIDTAKTAHAAVVSGDNRWVFVPHVAPNAIYQFRLDETNGKLTAQKHAPGGREGAGPRHLAIHPSQKFSCSSDESGNSITLYSLDADTGLKPLQTLSTLPADFDGKNSTADVKFHPSGKFVWVSNRGHDSLAGFRFDADQGQLTSIGQTPTEKTPRSFDVSPSGKWLCAAGEGNGKLAVYRIDNASGKLGSPTSLNVGKSLSWVLAVERE